MRNKKREPGISEEQAKSWDIYAALKASRNEPVVSLELCAAMAVDAMGIDAKFFAEEISKIIQVRYGKDNSYLASKTKTEASKVGEN